MSPLRAPSLPGRAMLNNSMLNHVDHDKETNRNPQYCDGSRPPFSTPTLHRLNPLRILRLLVGAITTWHGARQKFFRIGPDSAVINIFFLSADQLVVCFAEGILQALSLDTGHHQSVSWAAGMLPRALAIKPTGSCNAIAMADDGVVRILGWPSVGGKGIVPRPQSSSASNVLWPCLAWSTGECNRLVASWGDVMCIMEVFISETNAGMNPGSTVLASTNHAIWANESRHQTRGSFDDVSEAAIGGRGSNGSANSSRTLPL